MKSKYLIIVLAAFILLGLNATFASEHGNETLMMHESALEMSVEKTPSEILGENSGSYVDLKKDIDTTPAGGSLNSKRTTNSIQPETHHQQASTPAFQSQNP